MFARIEDAWRSHGMRRSHRIVALLLGVLATYICAGAMAAMKPAPQKAKAMHAFLALGDSYPIGEAVAEKDRWPVQLVARLKERGIALDAPRILATTGWTTDELSAAMDDSAFAPPYALVTLMIGVNNQYRGRDMHEYRQQFDALLARDRPRRCAGGAMRHA